MFYVLSQVQLVLMPGSMLEVVGVLSQGDLTMVQLCEVDTPLAFHEFPPKPAGSSASQGMF
jgi:hypothetical protein